MLFKLIIHMYLYHVFVEAVAEETLIVSSFIFLCLAAAKKIQITFLPFCIYEGTIIVTYISRYSVKFFVF